TEITVKEGGHDIYLDRAGLYDVYLDKTNGKVWVMEAGYKPGEEIARLDGNQWMAEVDDMQVIFDFGVTEEGMLCIALPTMDGTGFGLYMTVSMRSKLKTSSPASFFLWDMIGSMMK
ncbi:MAG: hypothetical protein IKA34_02520, partial [Bacteroidales bacterium]|nr:hypothetical protein [Bacteroidales bacterium]